MPAHLKDTGAPIGKPPGLVAMAATGRYWKTLFAVLAAAGHGAALLNPFLARRFQHSSLERSKTDAIDAQGLFFKKRPEHRRPFEIRTEQARAAQSQHDAAGRACGTRKERLLNATVSHATNSIAASAASTEAISAAVMRSPSFDRRQTTSSAVRAHSCRTK